MSPVGLEVPHQASTAVVVMSTHRGLETCDSPMDIWRLRVQRIFQLGDRSEVDQDGLAALWSLGNLGWDPPAPSADRVSVAIDCKVKTHSRCLEAGVHVLLVPTDCRQKGDRTTIQHAIHAVSISLQMKEKHQG